ncbi:zinc finger-like protein [Corynascus novoguineensis]|uniref:Zinc finger-like protein n=1 Tax=Corynascus novoguineensis TaxID=1126955 RepID=A0AAN7HRB8_9PEZI|nr:zinc finger-like protein [Corynascus novoguineensis]
MASPDPNNSDETSYVKMSAAAVDSRGTDASLVGSHCEYSYCNQLDFLPFRCQSCNKTFCLDHRTEDSHACANPGAWAARKREAELARQSLGEGKRMRDVGGGGQKPCADDDCKTTIGTALVPGVHCPNCNRDYCLKHRLREDHDCANKVPIGARAAGAAQAAAVAEGARSALERFRLWGQAKKQQAKISFAPPSSKPKVAQMLAVNNLKKTAKGDAKIAPEKRIYLYVEAEAATAKAKIPKGEFFYSHDWVVGKMLDAAARSLQVPNINNQSNSEEDKLRVFHVEGGRLLEFNEKLGKVLQSGNTVVLLRGVGPPPDLIET